jgi:hypothetical protein
MEWRYTKTWNNLSSLEQTRFLQIMNMSFWQRLILFPLMGSHIIKFNKIAKKMIKESRLTRPRCSPNKTTTEDRK